MKNIIKIGLVFLLVGCSTTKDTDIIPYVLDIDTEKEIFNRLLELENKDIMFYWEHLPDLNYKLHLISSINKQEFSSTNRKLFINNKFYPIVFDTDYQFYSKLKDGYPIVSFEDRKRNTTKDIKIPSISEREKNFDLYGYKKKNLIIDNSYFWIIDKKGKLIKK